MTPSSPFKGLAPFGDDPDDHRFFFGRERESEVVAANLTASRLTVLYGPSGVGKSSLLRAGVVRRLRALVPSGGPDEQVPAVAIVDSWRDDPEAAIATAVAAPTDLPLAEALAEGVLASGAELYLVLDQMEEYVLYHGRDGGPLAPLLEDVLTRPELPVHVLLGVRDDALADLDAFKRRLPALFSNVLRLDHLTRAAARAAIEGPLRVWAELGGEEVTAEEELVEAVLDEVAAGRLEQQLTGRGAGAPSRGERRVEAPYLQLVLERLWAVERERGSNVLRAATLRELGGAERIAEGHLERALGGLDDGDRDVAASLFNHLVTPSGTKIAHTVDDLARYAQTDPARLEPVLGALTSARILRRIAGRGAGPPRFEIFHDVLAPAVLAWRAGHEAGRALERERATSRRRHRRVAGVAAGALLALAGTTALAVWALSQRAEAREQTRAAEAGAAAARARELEASALVAIRSDPEEAVVLALRAARTAASASTEDVLRLALRESRVRTVARLGEPVADLTVLPGGSMAAVLPRGAVRLVEGSRVGRLVVPPARGARTWLEGDRALTLRGTVVTVRALPSGRVVARVPVPAGTRYVAAGPGGNRFVAAGRRGAWVVARDGLRLAYLGHPAQVARAAFSASGLTIATAGADGNAMVWDGRGRSLGTFVGVSDGKGRVFDVAFSHLSRMLATAGSDGTARVFNLLTRQRRAVMALHGNHVRRVRFSASNEDALLTASRDRTARTWKVEIGGPRAVFSGHSDQVTAAVFAPDDRIATASDDGTVRTWTANLQPPLRPAPDRAAPTAGRDPRAIVDGDIVRFGDVELAGHRDLVTSVEVSPDGRRIVTASRDGDARIWDARTGKTLAVLSGHSGTVFDASFSPDGRWVVTGGPSTAGLWDARTGMYVFFLQGSGKAVRAAEFVSQTRIVTVDDAGVRTYVCETCAGLRALVRLAERRLEATGRR